MIDRLIQNDLEQEIKQPEIVILLGPRQVGKTTLLKQIQEHADSLGYSTHFFDLEQPQTLAIFNCSDAEIIEFITKAGNIIFIDEFQYIKNASKILKAIYDQTEKIKLFCSGSSSMEIHKHLHESLAGRRIIFQIFPLSYYEVSLHFKNNLLNSYLLFGGMPNIINTPSKDRKITLLSELLSAYILKDIKALVKEENIRAFNHLLFLLAQQQGSLVSMHSLANEINMSSTALNRYLDIMEQTFVNFKVYSYSNNIGNELKKSVKTYFYDLGIRNCILKDFSPLEERTDKGVLYESYVFLTLRSHLKPNMDIKFWRTKDGSEVDFILLKDRKPIPIEVKSKLSDAVIPNGLKRFLSRYPNTKQAFVINENVTGQQQLGHCCIKFITFQTFHTDVIDSVF